MKKILIVDDEPANLRLLNQILKDSYILLFANNGKNAISAALEYLPDLILLDIMMPDLSGLDVCKIIKENKITKKIPVIFVTTMGNAHDESKGFSAGAVDYILKPVIASIVRHRVNTHLALVKAEELEESQKNSIYMLGEAGHFNDTDTGVHIWRMSNYASILANELGWSPDAADRLSLAASMHDTGKIGVPDAILKAPRKLTSDEWTTMQEHSEIGFRILSKSPTPLFQLAAEVALSHHEKWNGTGYPRQLSGESIPESARIVAIADVFDALTMKRPYKKPWSTKDSIDEIKNGAGSHFDPAIVNSFEKIIPKIIEAKNSWNKMEAEQRNMS